MTISSPLTTSNSELISFNGPSSVAINGQRGTIDGRSLILNGYNNVMCTPLAGAGAQFKDAQFVASGAVNLNFANCGNVRVTGDVISHSGSTGIQFGSDEATIADSTIEQSGGVGLDLSTAMKVTVGGNFFDDNGKGLYGGPAILIDNTITASICNNHLTGNGEYAPYGISAAYPAQIRIAGTNDGIDLCSNVYGTESERGDVTLKPPYAYDAGRATVLTNSHLYESSSPQAFGSIYSPNAAPILAQLQVPQIVPKQITGYTLVNSGTAAVQMLAGTAADSSKLLV